MKNLKPRRQFLKQAAVAGVSLSLPQMAFGENTQHAKQSRGEDLNRYPLKEKNWIEALESREIPYAGLATSLKKEYDYDCEVEGVIPSDLNGALFRTGPGLFDRNGQRRRMQIDADGMIRRFEIKNGKVHFANKHIRTEKFVNEEKAGKYLYPSFGMRIPKSEGTTSNSVLNVKNQATVTSFVFGGRLFATDEVQPLVELNPKDLSTMGEVTLTSDPGLEFMAHTRMTFFGEKLLHLAAFNKITGGLRILSFNEKFEKVSETDSVNVSRSFHDWHITPKYIVILLPPSYRSISGMVQAFAGSLTVADATEFRVSEKTQVMVIPRKGGKPKIFDLPKNLESFHSVNAHQTSNDDIIFDFIGAKFNFSPVSDNSLFTKIMRGEAHLGSEQRPVQVHRAKINFKLSQLEYFENQFDLDLVEMPCVDPRLAGLDYESAYFMRGDESLYSKIVCLNSKTNQKQEFDFGPKSFVTEPVYAKSEGSLGYSFGYILSEVYSHETKKSFLAIFDSAEIAKGPIAKVHLTHHLPVGFHGFWQEAQFGFE